MLSKWNNITNEQDKLDFIVKNYNHPELFTVTFDIIQTLIKLDQWDFIKKHVYNYELWLTPLQLKFIPETDIDNHEVLNKCKIYREYDRYQNADKLMEFIHKYYNDPNFVSLGTDMINDMANIGQWNFLETYVYNYKLHLHPLILAYIPDVSLQEQFEQTQRFCDVSVPKSIRTHLSDGSIQDKSKYTIAVLAKTLSAACIGTLLDAFIYCYPHSTYKDQWNMIVYYVDTCPWTTENNIEFKDVTEYEDNPLELAKIIYKDNVDILLNIDGNLNKFTYCVAFKPAPIIITWIGTLLTSGFEEVDYKLTDEWCDPLDTKEIFSEELIRIPRAFCAGPQNSLYPRERWKELPYFRNNYVTFACFNSFKKISKSTFMAWVEILKKVPNSKLLLKNHYTNFSTIVKQQVLDFFQTYDLKDRIIFGHFPKSQLEYREYFHEADIFLDTFPHGAASMAFDTVYMCRLIVTLKGNTHASRICASVYERMGVFDNIVYNVNEYINVATSLATNMNNVRNLSIGLYNKGDIFEHQDQQHDLYKLFNRLIEKRKGTISVFSLWNDLNNTEDIDNTIKFMHQYYNHPEITEITTFWNKHIHDLTNISSFLSNNPDIVQKANTINDMINLFVKAGQYEFLEENVPHYKIWLHPLQLSYLPNISHEDVYKQSQIHTTYYVHNHQPLSDGTLQYKKKYNIGILTESLNQGCIKCLLDGLIWMYPQEKYRHYWNLYVYHTGRNCWNENKIVFRNIDEYKSKLPFELAQFIHNDNIDILLNIEGNLTDSSRCITHKPAPIIINWIGSLLTSGYSECDYKLTDSIVDPLDTNEIFTEKLIRIPRAFCVIPQSTQFPVERWNELPYHQKPGGISRFFTFGCFNIQKKINKPILLAWAKILQQVPRSKLVLKNRILCHSEILQQQMIDFFTQQDIDPDRIIIGPYPEDQIEYRKQFHTIDLFLDTSPHGAASMAFDMAYMCRLIITLKGNTHAGRICASVYERMGINENIAYTMDEYVEKAVYLAQNPNTLRHFSYSLQNKSAIFEYREQHNDVFNLFEQLLIDRGLSDPFKEQENVIEEIENKLDSFAGLMNGDEIIRYIHDIYTHPKIPSSNKASFGIINYLSVFAQFDFLDKHFKNYYHFLHPLKLSCIPNISHQQFFEQTLNFLKLYIPDVRTHYSDGIIIPKSRYTIGIISYYFSAANIQILLGGLLHAMTNSKYTDKWSIIVYHIDQPNWTETSHLTFKQINHLVDDSSELAQFIYNDNIDILLNLDGNLTDVGRCTIYKPAPIIIVWLGTLLTSGYEESDYKITDSIVDPTDTEEIFSEKLIRMQRAFCVAPQTKFHPRERWYDLPYFRNNYITFGCFNTQRKISKPVFLAWVQILKQVPNSKLILKNHILQNTTIIQNQVLHFFKQHNISLDRIIFGNCLNNQFEYRKQFHDIDIYLDTFPHSAASMAFDMIYMCRIAITLKGNTHVGRICSSVYERMGVTDNIVHNIEEYVEKAVYFANNPSRLDELSRYLEKRKDIFEFDKQQEDLFNVFEYLINKHSSNI